MQRVMAIALRVMASAGLARRECGKQILSIGSPLPRCAGTVRLAQLDAVSLLV